MKLHELLEVIASDYTVLNQNSALMPENPIGRERYYNMDVEEIRVSKAYCDIIVIVHDTECDDVKEDNGNG